jgi:hypothetical protein
MDRTEPTNATPGSRHNPTHNRNMEKTADDFLRGASEETQKAVQRGKEATSEMANRAKHTAEDVKERSSSTLNRVSDLVSDAASSAVENIPSTDEIASTVSDTIQSGKDYLSERGIGDVARDLSGVVRKYPVRSCWAALGLGIVLGGALSRR